MGKKLDAILGRNFKTSKFKSLANLAVSRLAVFKNQRQVRCNHAVSDVVQLLEQGHHDRALLRVEHVIKEQNLLDAFVMMEGYLNLLIERVHLVEQDRVCPDELKEAISSLLCASTRCGEFPELQEIRAIFTSRYGKEFAARAIDLRNNCGVNPKMVQKLSTRQPELESRMKVFKEIASEKNIVLQLQEAYEERLDTSNKRGESGLEAAVTSTGTNLVDNLPVLPGDIEKHGFSDSVKARKKYKDVADAAQAAFESAAYAAAAARAAVELSRSDSHDPGDHNNFSNRGRKVFDNDEHIELGSELGNQNRDKESLATATETERVEELKRTSSTDSAEDELRVPIMSSEEEEEDPVKKLEKDTIFYDSESETHDTGVNNMPSNLSPGLSTQESDKQIPSNIQAGLKVNARHGYSTVRAAEASGIESSGHLDIAKGPISVRTRQVRGY